MPSESICSIATWARLVRGMQLAAAMALALAMQSCRNDPKDGVGSGQGADSQGYNKHDCDKSPSPEDATKYANILLDAFRAQINKGFPDRFFTQENVQRMVCMANEESLFGRDQGSLFSGTFQVADDTGPHFCKGLDYLNNEYENAQCALRINFSSLEGSPGDGRWEKWPLSSRSCARGSIMRACYNPIVNKVIASRCPQGLGRCDEPALADRFAKQCVPKIRAFNTLQMITQWWLI